MKLSLLFLESLKKQIKKLVRTYPSLDETTIRLLNSADPTGDEAKYTKWLTQQYIKGNINLDDGFTQRQEIHDKLAIFDKDPGKFNNRNIYKLDIKDLLETEATSESKIDYSELLQPPNRLLKEIGNYKLIEINAYQGMEQFKKESDTVPSKWCVAYPRMFKKYGPPMYLTIKNEEPYVMIVYHEDELKDRNDDPITLKIFKELLDLGFIDISKLRFIQDSRESFLRYIMARYDFDKLLKTNNPNYLFELYSRGYLVSDKQLIDSIIDFKAIKIAYKYGEVSGNYKPLEKIIIDTNDMGEAYKYALHVINGRWMPAEKMVLKIVENYDELCEDDIDDNVEYAFHYITDIVGCRWPLLEKVIIQNDVVSLALDYSISIIKGRWEPAEEMIAASNNIGYMYDYAKFVIKGEWEVAEKSILEFFKSDNIKDKNYELDISAACLYIGNIMNRSWPFIEKLIINNKLVLAAIYYAAHVIKQRWAEAEKMIIESNDAYNIIKYVIQVVKKRWRLAEKKLIELGDLECIYKYALDIVKDRWPEAEEIILRSKNSKYACLYAENIMKNRWLEAESFIKQDRKWWLIYKKFIKNLQNNL